MTGRTPAYVEISDRIAAQIHRGELRPGDQVPGEREITEQHRVSQNVARAAISRLRSQGLIVSRQGKGSFVAEQPEPIVSLRDGRDLRPEGDDRLLSAHVSDVVVPFHVAKTLGLSSDDHVTQILYRWTVNDEVVETSEYYEPLAIPGHATARPAPKGSSFDHDVIARFARAGVQVTDVEETTSARMPTSEEAHLMSVRPGVPVIEIQRIHYANKTPLALTHSVLRADRIILHTSQQISQS
ncbi:GntR family transcriptional regulator [Nonomuraea sp. NPDC026600]|uniref:GntR family transcriptional regulator n=1 Tax=Nonomuraea sp. NPDC026600 TaxID=3155363 RepID=UPI0033CD45D1